MKSQTYASSADTQTDAAANVSRLSRRLLQPPAPLQPSRQPSVVAELGGVRRFARPVNHATAIVLASAFLLQGCAIMPPCHPVARDISGRVLDAHTRQPIAAARVIVRETGDSFHTSATGTFSTGCLRRFWSPPPHSFLTLRASYRGYHTAELRVPISSEPVSDSARSHRNVVFLLGRQ